MAYQTGDSCPSDSSGMMAAMSSTGVSGTLLRIISLSASAVMSSGARRARPSWWSCSPRAPASTATMAGGLQREVHDLPGDLLAQLVDLSGDAFGRGVRALGDVRCRRPGELLAQLRDPFCLLLVEDQVDLDALALHFQCHGAFLVSVSRPFGDEGVPCGERNAESPHGRMMVRRVRPRPPRSRRFRTPSLALARTGGWCFGSWCSRPG